MQQVAVVGWELLIVNYIWNGDCEHDGKNMIWLNDVRRERQMQRRGVPSADG
jgi:hypothetical protein